MDAAAFSVSWEPSERPGATVDSTGLYAGAAVAERRAGGDDGGEMSRVS